MIKWYKMGEKMPEVGDTIVVFHNRKYHFEIRQVFIEVEEYLDFASLAHFWAYASEFNFPNPTEKECKYEIH